MIYGSGWKVHKETGLHFECILPIPFWTSILKSIFWFLDNFTIGIPNFLFFSISEKYSTGLTGLILSSSDCSASKTGLMSSEVTSMQSLSKFSFCNIKWTLQTWQSSIFSEAHGHYQGYLN